MTSKLSRFLVFFICAFLAAACINSNAPQKLDNFVDKTELNCDRYDANDWQKSMAQYENLVEEFNKPGRQYTDAEKQMAARAMGRYHSLLIKNGIKQSAAYLNELKSILPSYLDGLVEGLGEDSESIKESLESLFNSDELEQTFSNLGETLEELFGGLEDN